jgi:hypothetical protein
MATEINSGTINRPPSAAKTSRPEPPDGHTASPEITREAALAIAIAVQTKNSHARALAHVEVFLSGSGKGNTLEPQNSAPIAMASIAGNKKYESANSVATPLGR